MSATYPEPATPLPWEVGKPWSIYDYKYAIHAANAFPHLVAALEALLGDIQNADLAANGERALAIARGEVTP